MFTIEEVIFYCNPNNKQIMHVDSALTSFVTFCHSFARESLIVFFLLRLCNTCAEDNKRYSDRVKHN